MNLCLKSVYIIIIILLVIFANFLAMYYIVYKCIYVFDYLIQLPSSSQKDSITLQFSI